MAQKNNIRSIRFSDDLAKLIDQQVGRTFTEKFEGLITRCVWELPQKEAELERLNKELERLAQEINERQRKLTHLKSITYDLCTKVYQLGEVVDKEIKNWRV